MTKIVCCFFIVYQWTTPVQYMYLQWLELDAESLNYYSF